jgi:hypothetical protein
LPSEKRGQATGGKRDNLRFLIGVYRATQITSTWRGFLRTM